MRCWFRGKNNEGILDRVGKTVNLEEIAFVDSGKPLQCELMAKFWQCKVDFINKSREKVLIVVSGV